MGKHSLRVLIAAALGQDPTGCNMTNPESQSPSFGQAAPCTFVGKLAEKYPQRGASDGLPGEGKLTYKVTASVADEKSTTAGWQVGGKITPSISGDGGSVIGGASFTYSYSSTFTTKVQTTRESNIEINVPKGKKGYLEGRATGTRSDSSISGMTSASRASFIWAATDRRTWRVPRSPHR